MRTQIQAEQELNNYTRKHARHIIAGTLGNNAGTVDHATRTNFVYVRLHGDQNQVVEAEAVASFPHVAGIIVAVELVQKTAASRYQVLGIASNILYVSSPWTGTVGEHAAQHQRRDLGQGGFDPLDIYNRALVNLRGRAQTTPDLTLYVERGFYFIGGALYEWTGGNSAAFTVPAGSFGVTVRRCDLLYINAASALAIVQGATTSDGSVPPYPTTPYPCIPVAYVYLASSTTTIQETDIKDARVILTASDGTPVAHNLLSATHGDTLAASVAAGDLIIGNDTPKWSRLAITVPAANVRNVVAVDNGETKPSWKIALDATNPTTIAESAAAAPGTSLVFSHRDHTHGAPATWAPTAHHTSHEAGGGDAIKLDDLAAPDDNTDLDASITLHGLLPKLGGGTTNFLRADGTWNAPPGGSGHVIQDEGTPLTARANLNFVGAGVTVTDDAGNDASVVTIPAGGAHDLLSATHSDTLADTVVDGDILIGNVTPKWSRLAISVPAADVLNVLGVANGELRPSWKALFDATNPADTGTAAPGTSLLAAHRDHVHALATPGTLTVSTTNSAVAAHTHAITSSSNPGAAASLLATDSLGQLTLRTTAISNTALRTSSILTVAASDASGSISHFGEVVVGVNAGITNTGSFIAIDGSAEASGAGTGTLGKVIGGYFLGTTLGDFAGTVTGIYGVYATTLGGAGTANNAYSMYVEGPTGVGITNKYAVYQVTAGVNNYFASPANFNAGLNIAGGTVYTLISSNPGAAAAILATDASGFVTVQKVTAKPTGAGIALDPNSATGNYTLSLSPANLTGNRRMTFPDRDLNLDQWILPMSNAQASYPVSAANTYPFFASIPRTITHVSLVVTVYVATTNNGSHYWTFTFEDSNHEGASALATFNTSAISADTWTQLTVSSFSPTTSGTADKRLTLRVLSATGAPGNLFVVGPVYTVSG